MPICLPFIDRDSIGYMRKKIESKSLIHVHKCHIFNKEISEFKYNILTRLL